MYFSKPRTGLHASLLILLFCLPLSSQAQQQAINAFNFTSLAKSSELDQTANSSQFGRSRQVETWQIQLNAELRSAKVGDAITLPMPSGDALQISLSENRRAKNGDRLLKGEINGGGRALFTLGQTVSFANIVSPTKNFTITWDEQHGQVLIDNSSLPADSIDLGDDFLIPPELSAHVQHLETALADKSLTAKATGKTDIDILIVYSPEFAALFNSANTRINQLINFTNDAFDRSGILINLRLADTAQIGFNNSASINQMLDDATSSRGGFAGLGRMRDTAGADMVAVLAGGSGFSASGVAWLSGGFARVAYSVTRLSPGCCDSVFTHELGHNLGSGHEHRSANPSQGSPCRDSYTGYSCGHGNSSAGWGTIMSYLNGRPVGFRFSNLDSDCLGAPCGIAQGSPNAADNRTSFNITRSLVANFRDSKIAVPPVVDPRPTRPPNDNTAQWLTAILDMLL